MKTLLAIAAATAALFTFGTTDARADHTHGSSRVLSNCGHCHQPVFAYYRPISYVNRCAVYGWVPAYHNHASSGISIRIQSGTTGSRYNYGYRTPSVSSHNVHRSLHDYRHVRSYPIYRGGSSRSCR